ncbi:hypothetical protein BH24ACT18_BH24ACT18_09720 [soil metagenome]|jgi:hypothetical protein
MSVETIETEYARLATVGRVGYAFGLDGTFR